jgi:CheY-like chemotaxis protein
MIRVTMLGIQNMVPPNRVKGQAITPPRADQANASVSKQRPLLRKVLVVDDERDLADMTAALLSLHGLKVEVAYSAKEALQMLQGDREIDAILSDIVMPEVSGIQLAETVRQVYPAVKIVLVSGYTVPAVLTGRGKSFLFTSKPYEIETILDLLDT